MKEDYSNTIEVNSKPCEAYIAKVLEMDAERARLDKRVEDDFLNRFKTWEQMQRPWSGKW